MRSLKERFKADVVATGLKSVFYFKSTDFFETLTDSEQQKFIKANYVKRGNNRYVYFMKGNEQIGYLKLYHTL